MSTFTLAEPILASSQVSTQTLQKTAAVSTHLHLTHKKVENQKFTSLIFKNN